MENEDKLLDFLKGLEWHWVKTYNSWQYHVYWETGLGIF